MNKKIAICKNCGEPLNSTMMFSGAEYYCLNCSSTYGCFNIITKDKTKELKYTKEVYENVFKSLYEYITPYGCYKRKCDKCKEMNEYHSQHLSEKEIIQDKIARELLNKIGRDNNA